MKNRFGYLMPCLFVFALLVAACATIPTGPLAEGEVRVSSLMVPENVKAGKPYDVTFENVQKKGEVVLKEACFTWNWNRGREGPHCFTFTVREIGERVLVRLRTQDSDTYILSGYLRYAYNGKMRESNEVDTTLYVSP